MNTQELNPKKLTLSDKDNVSGSFPSEEDILKEAERQISDWLPNSTDIEKEHYRVAFRRSFEHILKITRK
jgi:hypothetical protein